MSRPGRPPARLARAGLDPARVRTDLEDAGLIDVDEDVELVADLIDAVAETADPGQAMWVLCQLASASPPMMTALRADPPWLQRAVHVAGASRPLGDLLVRHGDAVAALASDEPTTAAVVADEVAERLRDVLRADGTADRQELAAAVASVRRVATAAIAARDLTGAIGVEQAAGELSELAAGVLEGTLRVVHDVEAAGSPASRIAVIGMGKLGGHELNYVSDVDVLFVHETVEGADDEAATREAVAVCTSLLGVLNASTTMGRAYEVDPTLRPEGSKGALSRTVEGFVAYWERWAKTWEFQALLKARVVAGDVALGERLLAASAPYVFPDELDPGVVGEIRRMKGRVEEKPEVRRDGERQVKLGPGGIRDIEFAVQLLQVVHGRADTTLRSPGTLPALRALADGGYVSDEDAQLFSYAYGTLRSIEHRLQLASERRTHTIPEDPERVDRLARSLGYVSRGDETATEAFTRHLRAVQVDVRSIHQKLFYRPLLEVHAAVSVEDAGLAASSMDDAAARTRLEALGFADSRAVLRDARSMTSGLSRQASTIRALLPVYLAEVRGTPDPDGGVKRLRDVVGRIAGRPRLVGRLRDHPPTVAALAKVLGTSPAAGELIGSVPSVIMTLADSDWTFPNREERITQAQARLRGREPMAALRRLKREWLVDVVVADLLGDLDAGVIADELTAIGDACLDAGVIAAFIEAALERGMSRGSDLPIRFAVIGVGKLGGHELHYPSDLDVLFVHEPLAGADRTLCHNMANDVAERVIRLLGKVTAEGTAFEVDADLRPEGRSGPLSRSLESHAAYLDRWSETWEHQALLKARAVAGDPGLGQRYIDLVQPLAYPTDVDPERVRNVRMMKARVEKERGGRDNIKLGPGGLTDVEWTAQLLQLQYGGTKPQLRTTSTLEAIDAALDCDLIETTDAVWLRDGYRFLSRLRNRMWLSGLKPVDKWPSGAEDRNQLAAAMGLGLRASQELDDEYRRVTRRVRRVTDRVFFDQ